MRLFDLCSKCLFVGNDNDDDDVDNDYFVNSDDFKLVWWWLLSFADADDESPSLAATTLSLYRDTSIFTPLPPPVNYFAPSCSLADTFKMNDASGVIRRRIYNLKNSAASVQ